MALLELRGIAKHFGAIEALSEIDLAVEPGQIVGLMGDNGAGKSTLVKIIAGNFPPAMARWCLRAARCISIGRPTRATRASRSSTRISRCATT